MENKNWVDLNMIREDFFRMIHDRFGIEPDYPFAGDFVTAVFRRKDNLKWFAIGMSVDAKKLKIGAYGELDIVNLKCTDEDREELAQTEGVLPAYHMNKKRWLSVIMDEQKDFDEKLSELVQKSFDLTASQKKKSKLKTQSVVRLESLSNGEDNESQHH